VKEAARVTRIKELGDLFYTSARAIVDKEHALEQDIQQVQGGEEEEEETDIEDVDPGYIYSREHEEDDSYSFHESEASSDDDDGEEFGEGASGHSPLSMGWYKPDAAFADDSLDWLHEIESQGRYDREYLLAGSVTQIFPCIACNDHKNIINPTTWVPAFLRKASANTWDVFDIDLHQTVHDLEWEGDKGLANLWGLYYKCPDTQFMRTFKLNGTTGAASAPGESKIKDSAKITEDVHQEYHEPHRSCPNSDDATTAATTFFPPLQASLQVPLPPPPRTHS
jgi:hypothetical protein